MSPVSRPFKNIVLLLADQHRQDCLGCYSNPVVRTPNIDALANRGVRFTHAFTPAPVCTPARACLQTGMIARRHGLIFNPEFHRFRGGELNLRPETRLFANELHDAGWNLGHLGKWHIGDVNKASDYGYESVHFPGYGFFATHEDFLAYRRELGCPRFNLSQVKKDPKGLVNYYGLLEGPPTGTEAGYVATKAIEKIRKFSQDSRPFFVSANFWGPHQQYYLPQPYFDMYKDAPIDLWPNVGCDLSDKPAVLQRWGSIFQTGWMTPEDWKDMLRRAYGYITLIDDEVGRILKALDECGQLEDTLIIYTSDHGSADGSYRMFDKGFGLYDCLVRIPMVMAHASVKRGVNDSFVNLLDLAPTFVEAAGRPIPADYDGRSLLPVLAGSQPGVRDDQMIVEHFGHMFPFWQRMVRTREAKYILNPGDHDEFYDLTEDPYETHNLIRTASASRLRPFKEALRQWMADTKDPLLPFATRTFQ